MPVFAVCYQSISASVLLNFSGMMFAPKVKIYYCLVNMIGASFEISSPLELYAQTGVSALPSFGEVGHSCLTTKILHNINIPPVQSLFSLGSA